MKQNLCRKKLLLSGLLLLAGLCVAGRHTEAQSIVAPENVITLETPVVSGEYTKKKIKLTWKAVEGADTYYIYKKNSEGKYDKIGEKKKLYYTDKEIETGKYYTYKVAAVYKGSDMPVKSKRSSACKVFADGIDPNKKMVALTFDDGPGRYTREIVDCLKKNNGRATFFVLGCNIDSYKDALKAADQIGCEIGNHSYNHRNLTKLSEKEIKQQISQTDSKVKEITGKKTVLSRTPGGAFNDTVKKSIGKPIILWSIDTLDWKTRDKNKTIKAVMDNVKDGDIVLMHDIHEPSKEAACVLIPRLKQQGYQLVTVSELAKYRGYPLKKGTVYYSLRKHTQ
ncbi:MAG: polysaccharide deacetylase family protein [Lachnospiraceae bacterium]